MIPYQFEIEAWVLTGHTYHIWSTTWTRIGKDWRFDSIIELLSHLKPDSYPPLVQSIKPLIECSIKSVKPNV